MQRIGHRLADDGDAPALLAHAAQLGPLEQARRRLGAVELALADPEADAHVVAAEVEQVMQHRVALGEHARGGAAVVDVEVGQRQRRQRRRVASTPRAADAASPTRDRVPGCSRNRRFCIAAASRSASSSSAGSGGVEHQLARRSRGAPRRCAARSRRDRSRSRRERSSSRAPMTCGDAHVAAGDQRQHEVVQPLRGVEGHQLVGLRVLSARSPTAAAAAAPR